MARKSGSSRKKYISTAERERLRLAPGEGLHGERTVSIGDTLDAILGRAELADEHWLNSLREDWVSIAGDVAKHTKPDRIDGKCLYVSVDNSVWLNELTRFGGKPLLKKIHAAGFRKQVGSIRFQIGQG